LGVLGLKCVPPGIRSSLTGTSTSTNDVLHGFGLRERQDFIRVAMDEERRRIAGACVEARRPLAVHAVFGSRIAVAQRDRGAEVRAEYGERDRRLQLREVISAAAGDDALDASGFALDRIGVIGGARAVQHSKQGCRRCPRRIAGRADSVGRDGKSGGMMAYESHRTLGVFERRRVPEPRCRPMIDDEDGVTCARQRGDVRFGVARNRPGVVSERRVEAAPGNPHNSDPVRRRWSVHVHQQANPEYIPNTTLRSTVTSAAWTLAANVSAHSTVLRCMAASVSQHKITV
jgi:hypothetical protein